MTHANDYSYMTFCDTCGARLSWHNVWDENAHEYRRPERGRHYGPWEEQCAESGYQPGSLILHLIRARPTGANILPEVLMHPDDALAAMASQPLTAEECEDIHQALIVGAILPPVCLLRTDPKWRPVDGHRDRWIEYQPEGTPATPRRVRITR